MKKVIIAPLNWGLGHATRCVSIIEELQKKNFIPVIASDGNALRFLKKEFPTLEYLELPSYNISYSKNLKWTLFFKLPTFLNTVKKEQKVLQEYLHNTKNIVGIISDNRFGIHSKKIPSIYITHQINVLSGILTPITSYFHQRIIKKFNECWIPDDENLKLSGKLSKSSNKLHQKYIGILSRFKKQNLEQEIDVLIILSGPEPNRTQLESKLLSIFKNSSQKIYLIQGNVETAQKTTSKENITVVNFMLSKELEKTINASKIIVCRAGYSSILELISLDKNAILIPTKHQSEQEYLAKSLQQKGYFRYVDEENIDKKMIDLSIKRKTIDFKKNEFNTELFCLFQGE